MKRISLFVLDTVIVALISVALLLAVDFACGLQVLGMLHKNFAERQYRVGHYVYHHTLVPNFRGDGYWGNAAYTICTNRYGFKVDCSVADDATKDFDIAFIGDSFTEGVGLAHRQTFVGKIGAALPQLKIANLGVSSYSPTIYFAKLQHLLNEGFRFKEVVAYIDISDIQDEALSYRYFEGTVVPIEYAPPNAIKRWSRWAFPLTYQGLFALRTAVENTFHGSATQVSAKRSDYEEQREPPNQTSEIRSPAHSKADYLMKGYEKSAWTYDISTKGYGNMGVEGAVGKAVAMMINLHRLLDQRGIAMSVGVYPWAAQLLYDNEDSRQVHLWREFCKNRCKNFYNSFPTFFEKTKQIGVDETIKRYFRDNDVHHNEAGTEMVARDFLDNYRK
jgi:hypothetical protein